MDGAVPWGSDPLSEELSGLAKDAGALWTGSDNPTLLAGGAGAPHATRNWDIAFANGVVPPQQSFVARYQQLLNEVCQNHPQARIICCLGPLLQPPASDTLRCYLQQVLEESSLDQVYVLEFAPQRPEHGYGVTMHPSRLTHQLMTRQLSGFIAGLQAAQPR